MTDDRFEERMREAARDYHRPPATPREEMWTAIEAGRRRRAAPRIFVLRPAWRWGLSMAAVLLVGVAIGLRLRPETPSGVSASRRETRSDLAYGVAAVQYLNRTETLLTGFRADARAGRVDTLFIDQARELLTSTRLLMQCPAGQDPHLRPLLEDLELVLAQIALLPGGRRDTLDVDLITQGMDQQSVLTRLRTAIPAGPASAPRTQGAL
ncbi:MAG TPA: hypothetical protein VFP39_00110 [Gemmatimonadales bacterium]|nr:hypothetical protein [Gemmatimonadales bacterium]